MSTFTREQQVELLKKFNALMAEERHAEAKKWLGDSQEKIDASSVNFRCLLYMKLSKVECLLYNKKEALDTAEKALELATTSYEKDPERVVGMIDTSIQQAEALVLNGRSDDAEETIKKALSIVESSKHKKGVRHGLVLSMYGNILTTQGKWDEAVKLQMSATPMVEGTPHQKEIYLCLAQSMALKAEATKTMWCWDQAALYYHKVLTLMPKRATVQRGFILKALAQCLAHQDLMEESQPILQAAARIFLENDEPAELVAVWILLLKNAICQKDDNLALMVHNNIVRKLQNMKGKNQPIPPEVAVEMVALGRVMSMKIRLKEEEANQTASKTDPIEVKA